MITASSVVTSTTPLWYATRATGVIALVLLTASVVLGVLVQVRHATERWPRLVAIGVHRNLSLLVTVFLVLHIGTAELDSFAPVGWFAVLVPFLSAYRPLWLGLGTVAFDLLIAITVTSLLRTRVGHRWWRLVHWFSYACWPLAVVHGLGTGSDAKSPVILGLTVLCVLAVAAAGVWRLNSGWPEHAGLRVTAGSFGAIALVAGAAWTIGGPLHAGWAARAGTPAPPAAGPGGSPSTASAAASALPPLPLTTSTTGTISTVTSASGQATVTINGTGTTSQVVYQVVITGPAAQGGGVQMTGSRVTFGPTGSPALYTGHVTGLSGGDIQAAVTGPASAGVNLALNLTIRGPSVSGTLAASAGGGR
ncbi:MAG TPA: ferric reductase-like transmembrane domain-containing protein [Actinocrinis sp.]|nr:ferric reductase-like transmembrane domain-containing protein [Actinocrinis sp.]